MMQQSYQQQQYAQQNFTSTQSAPGQDVSKYIFNVYPLLGDALASNLLKGIALIQEKHSETSLQENRHFYRFFSKMFHYYSAEL